MKKQIPKIVTIYLISLAFGILFGWNTYIEKYAPIANNYYYGSEYSEKHNSKIKSDTSDFNVLKYDINLHLIPEQKEIEAVVNITVLVYNKQKHIEFNLSPTMKIDSIYINGSKVDYIRQDDTIQIAQSNNQSDTIIISAKYSGHSTQNKNFFFGKINGTQVIYTLNEPENARDWLLCRDIPNDKATVDFKIQNDSSFVSVSLGKLKSEYKLEGTSDKVYFWRTEYPTSPYLISFFSAPYSYLKEYYKQNTSDSLEVSVYGLSWQKINFKRIIEDHKDFISILENIFGKYPFQGEKYSVVSFLWQSGAMEYQTVSGFGSGIIDEYPQSTNIFVHELAHHWFGNSVTLKSWRDIWLNEGFASYAEWLYLEEIDRRENKNYLQNELVSVKQPIVFSGPLYAPEDLFNISVYIKGAWVLRMLRHELGDSAFFGCLKDYYGRYKFSNASTQDFIDICNKYAGKDLGYFFKQWIFEGLGIISLKTERMTISKVGNKYIIKLPIKQVQEEKRVYNFLLDIKFLGQGKSAVEKFRIDKSNCIVEIELPFKPDKFEIDPFNNTLFETIE
jgi:aminopeptidase N